MSDEEIKDLFEALADIALTLPRGYTDPIGVFDIAVGPNSHPEIRERLLEHWRERKLEYQWCVLGVRGSRASGLIRELRIVGDVLGELRRAKEKFPTWPTDPLHAIAVLGEEFGELNKAMLQAIYEPSKVNKEEIRAEAIQTAAMALRLIFSLERYRYLPCHQHRQPSPKDAISPGR